MGHIEKANQESDNQCFIEHLSSEQQLGLVCFTQLNGNRNNLFAKFHKP